MPSGTVKKLFADTNFCFITPDDGSEDVFVHRNSLRMKGPRFANGRRGPLLSVPHLSEGDKVEIEVGGAARSRSRSVSPTLHSAMAMKKAVMKAAAPAAPKAMKKAMKAPAMKAAKK